MNKLHIVLIEDEVPSVEGLIAALSEQHEIECEVHNLIFLEEDKESRLRPNFSELVTKTKELIDEHRGNVLLLVDHEIDYLRREMKDVGQKIVEMNPGIPTISISSTARPYAKHNFPYKDRLWSTREERGEFAGYLLEEIRSALLP